MTVPNLLSGVFEGLKDRSVEAGTSLKLVDALLLRVLAFGESVSFGTTTTLNLGERTVQLRALPASFPNIEWGAFRRRVTRHLSQERVLGLLAQRIQDAEECHKEVCHLPAVLDAIANVETICGRSSKSNILKVRCLVALCRIDEAIREFDRDQIEKALKDLPRVPRFESLAAFLEQLGILNVAAAMIESGKGAINHSAQLWEEADALLQEAADLYAQAGSHKSQVRATIWGLEAARVRTGSAVGMFSKILWFYGYSPARVMQWLIAVWALSGLSFAAFGIRADGVAYSGETVFHYIAACFYYSSVTISTLGYGDFTPSSAGSMFVAAIESIIGGLVLFPMLLIALQKRFIRGS